MFPKSILKMCFFVLFAVFLSVTQSFCNDTHPVKDQSDLQTLSIFFENDLFGNTDKYYTNAVQISWLSHDLNRYKDDDRIPNWAFPIIRAIPFSETPGSLHNVGILLGQHIYTPSDIRTREQVENDRPYAGFLYTGLALHSKTDQILDTLEITFGIVGPHAFAEFSQNTVHKLRDIPTALGWDNQLHDEPALLFAWQRKWRLVKAQIFDPVEYDLIAHAGVTLGNVRISARGGAEARLGYHIPLDFGSDVIRPGAGISTPATYKDSKGKHAFGMHLFSGFQLEAVGHDIFLDGNTFQHSPGVDKERWVIDLSAGLAFNFDRYKLTYRHLYRTRQFTNQKQDQIIGSLTLTVSF